MIIARSQRGRRLRDPSVNARRHPRAIGLRDQRDALPLGTVSASLHPPRWMKFEIRLDEITLTKAIFAKFAEFNQQRLDGSPEPDVDRRSRSMPADGFLSECRKLIDGLMHSVSRFRILELSRS